MTIVLDIILVAVIVLSAFLGSRRGFMRVLLELIGFIAVILLASWASKQLAPVIFEKHIGPGIEQKIEQNLDVDCDVSQLYQSLPSYLTFALDTSGMDEETVQNFVNEQLESGSKDIAPAITDNVVRPILTSVISAVLMFAIFLIGMFLVRLLARWINSLIRHTPIVGKLNTLLGTVFGALKGIIIAMALVWLLGALTSLLPEGLLGITNQTVQDAQLCQWLNQLNPLV